MGKGRQHRCNNLGLLHQRGALLPTHAAGDSGEHVSADDLMAAGRRTWKR